MNIFINIVEEIIVLTSMNDGNQKTQKETTMKTLLILILLSSLFLSGCTKNKTGGKNHITMTEDKCMQFGAKYDEEQGRKPGTWTVGNDGSCESKSTTHVKKTEQECVEFGAKRDKEEGREAMIWTSDVDGNCVGRSK